jgi:hypothetical protein
MNDPTPMSWYSRYAHEMEGIHEEKRDLLRQLLSESIGEDAGLAAMQAFPRLSHSMFACFPFWLAEHTQTPQDLVHEIAGANYLLSMINAILDPLLDGGDTSRAWMLPYSYVLLEEAAATYWKWMSERGVPPLKYAQALRRNMIALVCETHPEGRARLSSYSDVANDCRLLQATWELIIPVDDDGLSLNVLDTFLCSHKMFDDLYDCASDFQKGEFSLLQKRLAGSGDGGFPNGELLGGMSSTAFSIHCTDLMRTLSSCAAVFDRTGLVSLAAFVNSRLEITRQLLERAETAMHLIGILDDLV